ncbi:cyclically-permuted mutarotase family protein [Algoriphagus ratkowskyi]|uniref:Cyclically-permuted mutarotase family protein n=1 Tax=Algoriphagus ratkowskyi TaxID=57028 RepID=A0A2W7RD49_9BACT|nr:hypothetical protein [Algoriphagus ratkowskyi]PZX52109.1 cyclically-permuted mutarotase family protein [Algoriphagus ratkowskyi]TXD76127.1 hypothetical protein ESW18_17820 [Algoriphagus ratkowskyi]
MKLYLPLVYFLLLIFTQSLCAQDHFELKWDQIATLPAIDGKESLGFAGMYAGEHKGVIIMAGGANFPDGLPWEGGVKRWWDKIYVLQTKGDGFEWNSKVRGLLPENLGYGAAVSTPDGLLLIGGENASGPKKSVYLLSWNSSSEEVEVTNFPDLPIPLSHSSAAIIGSKVYLAGGESSHTSGDFWALELKDSPPIWEPLPSWPGPARSNAALIAQSNGSEEKLYLIGGRKKTDSGVSDLFSDVYSYDPYGSSWSIEENILDSAGHKITLSAFAAAAVGSSHILVFGGVKGENFSWLEETAGKLSSSSLDSLLREELISERNQLLNNHPGFSKQVLAYHTITKTWTTLEQLPFNSPVNTMAVAFGDAILLPSGEIFPGVRSPQIQRLTIANIQGFGTLNYLVLIGALSIVIVIGVIISKKYFNASTS